MFMLRTIGRRLPTLIAAALFATCLAWSGAAEAQTFTVTQSTDNGTGQAGTLSAAIIAANAQAGGATINFAPGVTTVTLSGSMVALSANNGGPITINGGGVTIDGQNQFQAFAVNDSTFLISFNNLTINRGSAQGGVGGAGAGGGGGGLGGGGGIYVSQTNTAGISIANVNFTNNTAIGGAGGSANGGTNGGAGGNFNQNASSTSTEGINGGGAQTGGGLGGVPGVASGTGNGVGNGDNSGYSGGGGGNSNAAANPTQRPTGNGGGNGGVNGQGGNGGNGLGGALFIGNGSTVVIQGGANFAASNTATGGAAGSGTPAATAGPGLGGSIYIGTDAGGLANAIFDTSTTDIFVRGDIYSNGNVFVQGGGTAVVNFLGNSTFMAPGTATTISSGTLNGTTSTIVGTITNNSIIRFTQNGSGVFNTQIAGGGRVDIEGGSFVLFDEVNTLTGASTNTYGYTGPTNVNNGTLFLGTTLTSSSVNVASTGTFAGNGIVGGSLTNSGLLSPGDGIGNLTVNGPFTSNNGSVTLIQLNSGGNTAGVNNDLITVNNAINLDGDVFVQTTGGVYSVGTTYTIISYNGVRNGVFDSVTTNSAFLGAELDYTTNPTQVLLRLTRSATSYASVAQTFNQSQVAGYLDANSAGAMGDFGTVLDNINSLSAAGARNAFDQLGGTIFGTTGRMGIQQTSFMYLMIRRGSRGNEEIGFEEIHADGRIAGEDGADDESIQLVNDNATLRDSSVVPVIRINRQRRHTWNAWSTQYGTVSTGIGAGLNSLDGRFGSFGTITSVYRYIDDGLKFGVFGAYNGLNLRLIQPYQSNNSADYQLGSYLRGDDGTSYFLAASSLGWDNYESARTIEFAQISRQAFANYDGYQTTGYLEVGRKTPMWPFDMEPFAALQYTYLRQNGFVESGADSINLSVPGFDSNSFRGLLGTRAALDLITLAGEPLKLELMGAWMHEFLGANTTIASTFAGVGGAAFGNEGVNFGRDWLVAGGGLNWAPSENTAIAANYDALLNDITTFHLFSANFQVKW